MDNKLLMNELGRTLIYLLSLLDLSLPCVMADDLCSREEGFSREFHGRKSGFGGVSDVMSNN